MRPLHRTLLAAAMTAFLTSHASPAFAAKTCEIGPGIGGFEGHRQLEYCRVMTTFPHALWKRDFHELRRLGSPIPKNIVDKWGDIEKSEFVTNTNKVFGLYLDGERIQSFNTLDELLDDLATLERSGACKRVATPCQATPSKKPLQGLSLDRLEVSLGALHTRVCHLPIFWSLDTDRLFEVYHQLVAEGLCIEAQNL